MSTTKEIEPFEMKDAVRQHFVDAVIAALNSRMHDGYGYGWHLKEFNTDKSGCAVMVFQTAITLRQWQDGKEWYGPHYVRVTVDAHTFEVGEQL